MPEDRISQTGTIIIEGRRCIRGRDVARILGISAHTVRCWRVRGEGPPWFRCGPWAVVYDEGAMWSWLFAQQRKATEARRRYDQRAWATTMGAEVPLPADAAY